MLTVEPTGAILGATIQGIDVKHLTDRDFAEILLALGNHGVLRFPGQQIDMGDLRTFSERFGEIQGPSAAPDVAKDNYAHVGTLSNLKENGKYVGLPDAGQDWHTDMSYRDVIGFVNVLYGIRIPRRDGVPLGGTEFSNMHAVYEALPADIRTRLADATATHDFEKFWEHMRRDKAATRPPMTDAATQAAAAGGASAVPDASDHRPQGAVLQPRLRDAHQRAVGAESDEMLEYLFDLQLEQRFRYTHTWTENDLLVWDHIGTIHRAIADYGPDEIRLMRRCQVMATKVFDPDFLRPVRELAEVA